jgi:hypothetical protein
MSEPTDPPPAPTTIIPPPARALGYKPDTPAQKAKHQSAKHLLGAPVRLPLSWSLMPATPPFKSQRATSSCVGFALWRAIDTRLAVMGVHNPPEHSARGCYDFARCWARGDANTPLTDDGCSPSDGFAAAAEWGVCLEADLPSDADALDNHINDEPDLQAVKDATAFRLTGVYEITSDGDHRVTEVCHAISQGYPVLFAIAVGNVFQNYDGSGDVGPEPDPRVPCNHAVIILAYETDPATGEIVFEGISPWEDWGKGLGRFTFRKALLCDPRTSDLYAVTVGPKPEAPKRKIAEDKSAATVIPEVSA